MDRLFRKKIRRVLIDEAHNIYSTGIPLYGALAHRPAWSQLSTLRIHFDNDVPFQALSSTLPPHIKSFIIDNLQFKPSYQSVTYTSNRPNLVYACRPVVGSLSDFRNLDFVLPPKSKTIIFFDSKADVTNATMYLDNHASWPDSMRGHGFMREYHSDMSTGYLTQTFQSFSSSNGMVLVLCATSCCATARLSVYLVKLLTHFCC